MEVNTCIYCNQKALKIENAYKFFFTIKDKFPVTDQHTLIITKRGNAFSMGDGSWGQLGLGLGVSRVGVPAPIIGLSPFTIRRIAAGTDHSLAIDDEGVLFSWGKNENGETGTNSSARAIDQPTAVSFECVTAGHEAIVGISARDHTLAWSDHGFVFAWGKGEGGCLGNTYNNNAYSPVAVRGVHNVAMASAGGMHTAVVCRGGALYTFGTSRELALGGGDCAQSLTPMLVMVDGCVTAACGKYHTSVVMNTGLLTIFGFSKRLPTLVEFTQDGYIMGDPGSLYNIN